MMLSWFETTYAPHLSDHTVGHLIWGTETWSSFDFDYPSLTDDARRRLILFADVTWAISIDILASARGGRSGKRRKAEGEQLRILRERLQDALQSGEEEAAAAAIVPRQTLLEALRRKYPDKSEEELQLRSFEPVQILHERLLKKWRVSGQRDMHDLIVHMTARDMSNAIWSQIAETRDELASRLPWLQIPARQAGCLLTAVVLAAGVLLQVGGWPRLGRP